MKVLLILILIITMILTEKWRLYVVHKKCKYNNNGWCRLYEVKCETVNFWCEEEEDEA